MNNRRFLIKFINKFFCLKYSETNEFYFYIRTKKRIFRLIQSGLIDECFFDNNFIETTSFLIARYRSLDYKLFKVALFFLNISFLLNLISIFAFFLPEIGFFIISLIPESIYQGIYTFLSGISVSLEANFYDVYTRRFLAFYIFIFLVSMLAIGFYMFLFKEMNNNFQYNSFEFKLESNWKQKTVNKAYILVPVIFAFLLFTVLYFSVIFFVYRDANQIFSVKDTELVTVPLYYIFIAIFNLIVLPFSLIISYALFLIQSWIAKSIHPEGCLLHEILYLIDIFDEKHEQFPATTKNRTGRRDLIYKLEKLIPLIKQSLNIRTNNPFESNVNEKVKDNAVNVIKKLKRWVYTPKPDTDMYIKQELAAFFCVIASGDIDAFSEGIPLFPENIEVKQSISFYIKRVAILISKIAIPFTIIFLIKALPFIGLNDDLYDYLVLGTSILAIVIILAELDPNIEERIKFLQEIILSHMKK